MSTLWNHVRTTMNSYGIRKDTLISLIDRDGNLYSMNAEMRRMLQIPLVEKCKTNIFTLVQKESVEEFKQSVSDSEKRKGTAASKLYFRNDSDHFISLNVYALPASGSEKQLFLCLGEEIKGSHHLVAYSQTELPDFNNEYPLNDLKKQTESLFESALENTPALSWMINENEELIFANAAYKKFFFLPEKAINQDIRKYMPYQVIQCLYEKHINSFVSEKPVKSIEKAFLADGSTVHFQVYLYPARNESGQKVIAGQAFILPKQFHEDASSLQKKNIIINNVSSDAVWEWDMRSGKIFRNNALHELLGFSTNETNGLAWWLRRIHPEDRERVSEKIKEATEKGLLSWEDKYRFKCADGTYKDVHDHGYIVYENGLPVKMIGSIRDISEVKKLKELLDKEKRERQQELSETVIQVQERERTRIGYELHDNINQILTTVNLFIGELKVEGDEQKKLKEKSKQYLLNAIEEIRDLSKALVTPHLKEKGLVESVRTLISDLHVAAAIRIDFIHDCMSEDELSSGKKLTLFRIVQEQLKNIFKYSQASKAEVGLYCKDRIVTLTMSDNGRGFDPRQTNRGIGLSNIFERTRFYNGSVTIDTAPNKGCVLTVKIPVE